MVEILGVVYEVDPDDKTVPPVNAAYQSMVSPAPGVAEISTAPVPQRDALTAVGDEGTAFTVAVTDTLEEETQPVVVFLV